MRRSICALVFAGLIFSSAARASESIAGLVPHASVVGRGVLTYAFWDVYEATLYAPKGSWKPSAPFALSIEYYHAIDGKNIADKSVQEMRRQGFSDEVKLAAWNVQMKSIFPDVEPGTVLSAVYVPGKETRFYRGSKFLGSIKGDVFARAFFNIWLGENSSEQKLRNALLGSS